MNCFAIIRRFPDGQAITFIIPITNLKKGPIFNLKLIEKAHFNLLKEWNKLDPNDGKALLDFDTSILTNL